MAVAFSSSSMFIPAKHDVFLSFRGEDTREKFTSHLHAKLIQKNIETYIDYRLPKGGDISKELIEAIKGSRISVIIFSKNYASSSWCLDEVVCILKCKEERGQIVVPVFYDVDPSHVRKQLGSYKVAFAKHEGRFKERMEKVHEWRSALAEAAGTSGWDSHKFKGTEFEFVEAIAKDILVKLHGMYSSGDEFKDLVGIEERFKDMKQLLCINNSKTVRFIGVWGMGGLGKTTLARVIFQRLASNFLGCCFLENVREKSRKHEGLESLKIKLFSELLKENDLKTINSFHTEKVRFRKVLVVLDDVDAPEQLQVLAADPAQFGPGSRIVITTRDAQVLRNRVDVDKIYKIEGLASDDALQLLKLNAFRRNHIYTSAVDDDDDEMLFERVVRYAKGNPLALTVLGSFLRSRKKENWDKELEKLHEFPNQRIHGLLKISFDGLDETEQDIFLDIVCLFRLPTCRELVERRIGAHRSYVDIGIDSLIDKSLITVRDGTTLLVIHDLLKEMGWEIERQRGIVEPGKHSRFWQEKHLYHVFKNNKGTLGAVEGISCLIDCKKRDWSPTMFQEMDSLWWLDAFGTQHLQYLPDSLKFLIWNGWPWKSLPLVFMPHNLVELRMRNSELRGLWNGGFQNLGNLKYVDLSYCKYLTDISALSRAPNLVSVDLKGCKSLCQVPQLRFRISDKLTRLDQSNHRCDSYECTTLGHLILEDCTNLLVVDDISGNLKELHLCYTAVAELPSSISSLDNLECLNLRDSVNIISLPIDIHKLKSLKRLDLNGCFCFAKLPAMLPRNLIELDLSRTLIEHLPSSSIENLSKLIKLSIHNCRRLKSLPELPLSLELLDASGCISLTSISYSRNALIQGFMRGNHVMASRTFNYADCVGLDENTLNNIVTEFQLRTLDTSIKSVLQIGGSKESYNLGVGMSFPGNKIPTWFTYQSESSSINVKLPCGWNHANFLGFALCAVVSNVMSPMRLSCEANFKTNYAKSCKFHSYSYFAAWYSLSNVFMWYKHENYHDYLDAVEVLFRFYNGYNDHGLGGGVRACGIRLLYRQDAEEMGIVY